MDMLKAVSPSDKVTDEVNVWQTGTRIDVTDEGFGKYVIYELKVAKAEPLNLYQLKMYWDGLVLAGVQPTEGVLLAQSYTPALKDMADKMNAMPAPNLPDGHPSAPYNFKLATHQQKCLT